MGSGTVFSIRYGQKDEDRPERERSGVLCAAGGGDGRPEYRRLRGGLDWIIWALRTPAELVAMMHDYLRVIFAGLAAVFLYNFFASLLRSLGDSATPLAFLAVSAGLNIVLDLWFVAGHGARWRARPRRRSLRSMSRALASRRTPGVRFPALVRRDPAVRLRRSRIREDRGFFRR